MVGVVLPVTGFSMSPKPDFVFKVYIGMRFAQGLWFWKSRKTFHSRSKHGKALFITGIKCYFLWVHWETHWRVGACEKLESSVQSDLGEAIRQHRTAWANIRWVSEEPCECADFSGDDINWFYNEDRHSGTRHRIPFLQNLFLSCSQVSDLGSCSDMIQVSFLEKMWKLRTGLECRREVIAYSEETASFQSGRRTGLLYFRLKNGNFFIHGDPGCSIHLLWSPVSGNF